MIEAYPLNWPANYPRTKYPKRSQFNISMAKARDGVIYQVRKLGGRNLIISSNVHLKPDGFPYASWKQSKISDYGVAVYFTYDKEPVVFCCDRWDCIEDNMQAINKSIEAIRGLDRWGVSEMLKRVFTGFEALPESGTKNKSWWSVFGVDENADFETVKNAMRKLQLEHHPDRGGSSEKFIEISEAWLAYQNKTN